MCVDVAEMDTPLARWIFYPPTKLAAVRVLVLVSHTLLAALVSSLIPSRIP